MLRLLPFSLVLFLVLQAHAINWKQSLRQDADWYSSDEAVRVADIVILYQREAGGWPKNTDMAVELSSSDIEKLREAKNDNEDCTIDNGATHTQLRYLARVYQATKLERLQTAFNDGVEFLLKIQYDNGGWPQFPYKKGYYTHITFNDGAMIGVMNVLKDIADAKQPYAFVADDLSKRCAEAFKKGVQCILDCQIEVDGARTVWCAQHDETTLKPAPARTYEKISLSGAESAGVVEFLMELDKPSPQIKGAIHAAMAWFEAAAIHGTKVVQKPDPNLPKGYDRIVVKDESAPPMWARFYEIGTNRPIFCGRDGVIKYSLAEIEHERRVGYSWYTNNPSKLVNRIYPEWKAKVE